MTHTTNATEEGIKELMQLNVGCGCTYGHCTKCLPVLKVMEIILTQELQKERGRIEKEILTKMKNLGDTVNHHYPCNPFCHRSGEEMGYERCLRIILPANQDKRI